MSISLLEVIEAGGYDMNTIEDCEWLVSKQSEFEELITRAENLIEKHESIENEKAEAEYDKRFPKEEE